MNIKTIITMITAVTVAGLVLGASFPIVESISQETTSVNNDGSGWVRFNYDTSNESTFNYDVEILEGGGAEIYSSGGASPIMSGSADSIIYADNNVGIWTDNGVAHILGMAGENKVSMDVKDSFSIEKTAEGISVYDSSDNVVASFGVPTWSYIPASNGNYGYFNNGTDVVKYPSDMPISIIGNFGLNTYNDLVSEDYGFTLNLTEEGDNISGGVWEYTNTDNRSINSTNTLRTVPPTPTYTSGVWGYDLFNDTATIVSYSGPSGPNVDITVPTSLDGYTVATIGKSTGPIFDTSLTFGSLIIPSNVTINKKAFQGCSGFTGTLTLPNNLKMMLGDAFQGCSGFTGTLKLPSSMGTFGVGVFSGCSGFNKVIIPSGLTTLPNNTFNGCSGLDGSVTIPSTITYVGSYVFQGCVNLDSLVYASNATPLDNYTFANTGIKKILNLSEVEFTTTSYGLNADEIRNDIPASGYISVVSYSKTVTKEGAVYTIIELLPLIMSAGLVIASIVIIGRRF